MAHDRRLIWRRNLDGLSFELAELSFVRGAPVLKGRVMVAEAGAPMMVDYRVACDRDWRTREVRIRQEYRGAGRAMRLRQPRPGTWLRDGRAAPDLEGCLDVDLGVSPSTNLLPIRRLALPEGGRGEIRAAWVRFPELTVTAAPQAYEHLGPRRYRYLSLDSGFAAILELDDVGLPVVYGDIWERIAISTSE